jgi:hypothetical protein
MKYHAGSVVCECILNSTREGKRAVAGSCEHVIDPTGSIRGGEFLD